MMLGPLVKLRQKKHNSTRPMEKIMKNETHSPTDILEQCWRMGAAARLCLFSSDLLVYLLMAPASAAPSFFSSPLSLRQVSHIICTLVSHFKVNQQLRALNYSTVAYSGLTELNYRLDWPHTSSPIYLDNNCPNNLDNTSACKQCAVP